MPCCYIGTHLNGIYSDPPSMQLVRNLNNYGPEKLNLNNHSLEEILSAEHLDRLYSDTWNKTTKEGKLVYCSKTCGTFSSIDKIFKLSDFSLSSPPAGFKTLKLQDNLPPESNKSACILAKAFSTPGSLTNLLITSFLSLQIGRAHV